MKIPNTKITIARNASRAQKAKAINREVMREKFKGVQLIASIQKSCRQIDEIIETLSACTTRRLRLTKEDVNKIMILGTQEAELKLRLDAIKQKADMSFKQLKFVLPELRSVEIIDSEGKNPFANMAAAIMEATRAAMDE